jgi:hypothetical protein
MKSNEYILFSFFSSPGMEKKFFGNLINFIKIIKLNNLYNKDANILEEIVPIKMIQFAKNFRITYNILNKQLKIEKSIYSVEARIRVYELKIKANQY